MIRPFVFTLALTFRIYLMAYPGLTEVMNFGANPGNLALFTYSPDGIDQVGKRPLVVVLHGCNQSAGAIARTSDWNLLADRHNFFIAYPEQQLINNPSRCFNWFRDKDMTGSNGEVESIHQMVLYMQRKFAVDSTQIYIYGVSAGAAISVCYIASHPEVMKAGAILAGSAYGMADNAAEGVAAMLKPKKRTGSDWENRIRAARPDFTGKFPKLVVMHGLGDDVVDPENSRQLVKQWLALHGTDSIPEVIKEFAGAYGLVRYSYKTADGTEIVIHYEMEDLGHALSVFPGEGSDERGGKAGMFSRDRSFFSTYWIAKDFGLILAKGNQ